MRLVNSTTWSFKRLPFPLEGLPPSSEAESMSTTSGACVPLEWWRTEGGSHVGHRQWSSANMRTIVLQIHAALFDQPAWCYFSGGRRRRFVNRNKLKILSGRRGNTIFGAVACPRAAFARRVRFHCPSPFVTPAYR